MRWMQRAAWLCDGAEIDVGAGDGRLVHNLAPGRLNYQSSQPCAPVKSLKRLPGPEETCKVLFTCATLWVLLSSAEECAIRSNSKLNGSNGRGVNFPLPLPPVGPRSPQSSATTQRTAGTNSSLLCDHNAPLTPQ